MTERRGLRGEGRGSRAAGKVLEMPDLLELLDRNCEKAEGRAVRVAASRGKFGCAAQEGGWVWRHVRSVARGWFEGHRARTRRPSDEPRATGESFVTCADKIAVKKCGGQPIRLEL